MRTKSLLNLVCITALVGCATQPSDPGEFSGVSPLGIEQSEDGLYVICSACPRRTMKTPWRILSTQSAVEYARTHVAELQTSQSPTTIRPAVTESSVSTKKVVNDQIETYNGGVNSTAPLLVLRFPFDVVSVQADHRQLLVDFATNTWPDIKDRSLTVVGFTDDTGPQRYNDLLALRRADSVAKALRELGIDKVKTTARGKCCYLSSNDTPKGRANNRRVEIRHFFNHENTRSRSNEH